MSSVQRYIVDPFNTFGSFSLRVNMPPGAGINEGSGVFATICELQDEPPALNVPFLGAAFMEVRNIVPQDDGSILIVGSVDAPSDVKVGIQILVSND